MSAAELSLDISALVSRAQAGEVIDASTAGQELAVKYPALGMSPEMIGRAIGRAAEMVGVRLDGVHIEDEPADTLAEAPEPEAPTPATPPGGDEWVPAHEFPASAQEAAPIEEAQLAFAEAAPEPAIDMVAGDFQFELDVLASALSTEEAILLETLAKATEPAERPNDHDALAATLPPPRGRMATALRRALFRA